jgi:hypothetical protein
VEGTSLLAWTVAARRRDNGISALPQLVEVYCRLGTEGRPITTPHAVALERVPGPGPRAPERRPCHLTNTYASCHLCSPCPASIFLYRNNITQHLLPIHYVRHHPDIYDVSSNRPADISPCRVLHGQPMRLVPLTISRNFEPRPSTFPKRRPRRGTVSTASRMGMRPMMSTAVPMRRGRVSPKTIRRICTVWAKSKNSRCVAQESCGWETKHARLSG